mgnify:FL=1
MAWVLLMIAGVLEIAWALGMKASDGFSKLWPSVFTIVTMIASFTLLAIAMKSLPVGTAYATWTGIGAAGAAIFGMVFFKEAFTLPRVACVALIVAGIIGLKLSTPDTPKAAESADAAKPDAAG